MKAVFCFAFWIDLTYMCWYMGFVNFVLFAGVKPASCCCVLFSAPPWCRKWMKSLSRKLQPRNWARKRRRRNPGRRRRRATTVQRRRRPRPNSRPIWTGSTPSIRYLQVRAVLHVMLHVHVHVHVHVAEILCGLHKSRDSYMYVLRLWYRLTAGFYCVLFVRRGQ